jgi:signal transduction histidine kinase/CheY-like chemotaxis protein/HPt (histidine-containing phosphotransfer) domain-containing protein
MLKNRSIQTKLSVLGIATICIGISVSTIYLGYYQVNKRRDDQVKSLKVIAHIIELTNQYNLIVPNPLVAEQQLYALNEEPSIKFAVIYDCDGALFAKYEKAGKTLPDYKLRPNQAIHLRSRNGEIIVGKPIIHPQDSTVMLGSVLVVSQEENLYHYFEIWGFSFLTTIVIAILASSLPLLMLHRAITRPILELAETTEYIAFKEDYTIRVQRDDQDEIGRLYDQFNRLLEQVHLSETQLKSIQADLIQERNNSDLANKTKSEFLANMSHEIRTPLTGILGFTDLLLARAEENDVEVRIDYLKTIKNSGKHLLNLINDILDLSKIESGQMEIARHPFHPHEVLQEVYTVLKVKTDNKKLKLDYRWLSNVPLTIYSDASRLRQILINLVGNSTKFTNKGGVAMLARTELINDKEMLVIDVIDTGIGIAEHHLTKLFQSFVQADNSVTRKFGGTGLGLAISRRFARLMGGDITVRSQLGEGSAFTLVIEPGDLSDVERVDPAKLIKKISQAHEITKITNFKIHNCRILLVDDGDTNRKLISLILSRTGAHVDQAENGKMAIDAVLSNLPYDLIFMDMQMPVMDGYTAASELRIRGFNTPIIALTAHAMSGDREKCLNAGCSDYLTKPIDTEKLLELLLQYLPEHCVVEDLKTPSAKTQLKTAPPPDLFVIPTQAKKRVIVSSLPTDDIDFQEIVEEYVLRLAVKLKEIETSLAADDFQEIAILAHWLKGSGGTTGFGELSEIAKELEISAKAKNKQRTQEFFQKALDYAHCIEFPWKNSSPLTPNPFIWK